MKNNGCCDDISLCSWTMSLDLYYDYIIIPVLQAELILRLHHNTSTAGRIKIKCCLFIIYMTLYIAELVFIIDNFHPLHRFTGLDLLASGKCGYSYFSGVWLINFFRHFFYDNKWNWVETASKKSEHDIQLSRIIA